MVDSPRAARAARASRFPADCLGATAAIERIGSTRFGAAWRPYCPLCLERAGRQRAGKGWSGATRYGLALVAAGPIAVTAWTMVSSHAKLAGERYLTARLTFALLAAACAALLAVYGLAGIARRRGWFHRHPPADAATVDAWQGVIEMLAGAIIEGRIHAHALTLDGERTAIGADTLPHPVLLEALGGADSNAAWAAVAKVLRLRNAPSGELVLDRADIERLCAACESG